jgi:LPXTG-site transpeptidase (sortase) family protein
MSPTTFDMVIPNRPLMQRHLGVHRKNYLESYAKQRARGERTQLQIATQPAVAMDIFKPTETKTVKLAYISHDSLLQTLVKRHRDAVAAAPDAEDTVLASLLSVDTSDLFEELSPYNLQASAASASHIRTIILSAIVCGVLATCIYTVTYRPSLPSRGVYATSRQVTQPFVQQERRAKLSVSNPQKFSITELGIDAPVVSLGLTKDGAIAVPEAYQEVGWYQNSSVPGKSGPTVLVGHYAGGLGAVFDNLHRLEPGSLLTVTLQSGQNYTYRITGKSEYDRGRVPMQKILSKGGRSRLEIITCAGAWDTTTYAKRLVVTAELVK